MTRFDSLMPIAVLLVLLVLSATVSAHDRDKKPVVPPASTPATPTAAPSAPDNDRKSDNLYVAIPVSGLLAAHLRDEPYGALKAVAVTTLGAAAIEAGHSGAYNGSNVWYAFAGAAIGSIGTCKLFFSKGFAGCMMPFK